MTQDTITHNTTPNNLTFEQIIQDPKVLRAIKDLGFTTPTEIQAATIPPAIKGQDLIGQAKTGSGKTFAFGVPLLHHLTPERRPQALILAPTRELCQQIAAELAKLAKHTHVRIVAVFGGVSMNPQSDALRESQIVVATPGRLMDHLERGTFRTEGIHFLVFDEADRMFDMGFVKDMERIVKRLPPKRQTLLFSATMPDAIKRLTAQYQHNPVHVKAHALVEEHLLPQFYYRVAPEMKFSLLVHLLKKEGSDLAMIFCQTKHGAKALARNLQKQGLEADAMHGNLSQAQRDRVLADFKAGKIRFLVATDIAARGIDIKYITHVFNYNIPHVPEDYVHRIGRTARAGEKGMAISLIDPTEQYSWRDVMRLPNVHATELRIEGQIEPIAFQKGDRSSDARSFSPRSPGSRPHGSSYRPAARHGSSGSSGSRSSESGDRKPATGSRTHFGDKPRYNKPSGSGGSRFGKKKRSSSFRR